MEAKTKKTALISVLLILSLAAITGIIQISKTKAVEVAVAVLLSNLSDDRALAVFERKGVVQIGKLTVGEANIKDRSDNLYDSTGIWQYGHSFQDCSAPATISVISCVIAP